MTVKADRWIIKQCIKPTHVLYHLDGTTELISGPPYKVEESRAIVNYNPDTRCEILSHREYARPVEPKDIANWQPMITPFQANPVRYVHKDTGLPYHPPKDQTEIPQDVRRIVSYGVSSYGYDVRLDNDPEHIAIFTNVHTTEINPKKIQADNFARPEIRTDEEGGQYVLIPPHSYLQAPTVEYFRIPRDILVTVLGKSTLARAGLLCNVTPMEPEWEGNLVVEIANLTDSPVRCYLLEGCAQLVFNQSDEPCHTSYRDKGGKYQGQTGLTHAKV